MDQSNAFVGEKDLLKLTLRRSPYDYTKLYLCGFFSAPKTKTIIDFLRIHRCPRPIETSIYKTIPGNEICVKLRFKSIGDMLYTEFNLLPYISYSKSFDPPKTPFKSPKVQPVEPPAKFVSKPRRSNRPRFTECPKCRLDKPTKLMMKLMNIFIVILLLVWFIAWAQQLS